jgi:hypothetical protein
MGDRWLESTHSDAGLVLSRTRLWTENPVCGREGIRPARSGLRSSRSVPRTALFFQAPRCSVIWVEVA